MGPWPGAGRVLSDGFGLLTRHYGVITGGTALLALGYVVGSLVPFVGSFVGFFLAPFSSAIVYCAIRLDRGQSVDAMAFVREPGSRYWWLVLIGLLLGIVQFAAMIPAIVLAMPVIVMGAANKSPELALAIGSPLILGAVVTAWYFYGRLMFAPLLFMDSPPDRLDFTRAFTLSWERTKSFAWGLVWFQVLLGLIIIGSALVLCVGVILLGLPLAVASMAVAYRAIFPEEYQGLCPRCGYDCRTLPNLPCPECGGVQPA